MNHLQNLHLEQQLASLYQGDKLKQANDLFNQLLKEYNKNDFKETTPCTQETVYLITYGDSFFESGKVPLQVLKEVVADQLAETVSDVHLLPMFPYTSDDGFSVTDYLEINSSLGDWRNIEDLAFKKRLMFDFVANHMSKSSKWFESYLNQEDDFEDAFVTWDPSFDATNVTRPRTSPLFHSYQNKQGTERQVWTTFSEDQVDVNPKDPKMLVRLTKILLEYVRRGATSVRLDAIGFLWKESGTTSMHLPQTHMIIQIWRKILDYYAPNTQIITETNVPHKDNISYFGNGSNEANQVYQFPLPPLVLHSFVTGSAEKLSQWASEIQPISKTSTYFNFLASHDGIGLRPTEGILNDGDRENLVERVKENGGRISYKNNPDGSQSVYEMNINYSEALKTQGEEHLTTKKMIAAHHLLLSFIGVPAIYVHSIFGSKNDQLAVEESGINRRINRGKLNQTELYKALSSDDYRKQIFEGLSDLILIRKKEKAFDPYGSQQVQQVHPGIFSVVRESMNERIVSYTNVTNETIAIRTVSGQDLISGDSVAGELILGAYDVAWIKEEVK